MYGNRFPIFEIFKGEFGVYFVFSEMKRSFFVIFGIQVFIFNYEYVRCDNDIRITSL